MCLDHRAWVRGPLRAILRGLMGEPIYRVLEIEYHPVPQSDGPEWDDWCVEHDVIPEGDDRRGFSTRVNEHVGAACCLVVYDGRELLYAVPTEPYHHHPVGGFNYHVESRVLYDTDPDGTEIPPYLDEVVVTGEELRATTEQAGVHVEKMSNDAIWMRVGTRSFYFTIHRGTGWLMFYETDHPGSVSNPEGMYALYPTLEKWARATNTDE